jgi:hypothetical protein
MIINDKYFSQKCPKNRKILKVDVNMLQKFGYKPDKKNTYYKTVDNEKLYALFYKGIYYICDKIISKNLIKYIEQNDKNGYYISNTYINDQFFEQNYKIGLIKINEEIYYYISPIAK